MADITFYSPLRGNDFANNLQSSLSNLMMMKKQQEEQEKIRAQQVKEELNRIKMQHDLQKQLIQFQAVQERKTRQQQFQDTVSQSMQQFQQAQPSLQKAYTDQNFVGPMPDGQPKMIQGGQQALGAAQYGAMMGQPLSPRDLLSHTDRQQGYQINPEDMLRYQQAMQAAQLKADTSTQNTQLRADTSAQAAQLRADTSMQNTQLRSDESRYRTDQNNQTQMTISELNRGVALAKIKSSREIADERTKLYQYLGEIKAGNAQSKQKADISAARMIEYAAKNLVGSGKLVTDEDRAEAIKQLATMYPETFGQYLQAVTEKPNLIFPGSTPTLKAPSGNPVPVPSSKPLDQYSW